MSRTQWILDRTEAIGERGMVAAKHELAAEAGVRVLQAGGNAVDAAIATAFAIGVVEPFMNGIGGGGFMVVHLAGRRETVAIDYGMAAPVAARPDLFELEEGEGLDPLGFGWRAVRDQANIHGPRSAAVPGTVAGLALAAERYGTMPLRELIQPAIALARDGFPVSWHTSLKAAQQLDLLNRYPATRAIFTDDGHALAILDGLAQNRLVQADLARTLEAVAEDGPGAFYQGPIAGMIADAVQGAGGLISRADLAGYQVRVSAGLESAYRGRRVVTMPAPSGGPTLLESLRLMERADLTGSGHNSVETLHHLIESFRQAFADRYAYLGDPEQVEVPVTALLSDAYIESRSGLFGHQARHAVEPGPRELLGVSHRLARSLPGYGVGGDTTHLSVMDGEGNAVSLTQTLLSLWGSFFTVPGTGILLNNGMMWFDPEPGRPNSVAGGKRPLSNMAPALVLEGDRAIMSVGSMGGRRIMNANAQLISNVLDHGLGMQAAISAPRVDCSGAPTLVSSRIAPHVVAQLRDRGHRLQVMVEDVGNNYFASPAAVWRAPDGSFRGGANPYYPAMAIGY